jgi:hypothetical protein
LVWYPALLGDVMKLKFLQDVKIAQHEVWLPILSFKKGQVEDIDNEYLIERLFHYKYVVKINEKTSKRDINKKSSETEGEKSQKQDKNKAHITPKNKGIVGDAENVKDLDVEIDV